MFAIRKFHRYILCRKFTTVTDHLPLVGIFKPYAPIPDFVPPRRLRWILTVACYDCNIVYKPGKSIPHADYLSRSPLPIEHPAEELVPAGIHLFEAKDLEALSSRDIASATHQGRILRQVIRWTQQGWPDNVPEELRPYWTKRQDLKLDYVLARSLACSLPCSLVPPPLKHKIFANVF